MANGTEMEVGYGELVSTHPRVIALRMAVAHHGGQRTPASANDVVRTAGVFETYLGTLRPPARPMRDTELQDAVWPEGRRPPRPRPAEASGDLPVPVPWPTFYERHGILPAQAVTLIRSRFPEALGPAEDEAETWPAKGTVAEVEAAVRKLENLDDQRAIGAQEMIVDVMTGARKEGPE